VGIIDSTQLAVIDHLVEHDCINTLTFEQDTASLKCQIYATIQSESINVGKWYDNTYTINDASDLGYGIVYYNVVEYSVGPNQTLFTKNSGDNLRCIPIRTSMANNQTGTTYTFTIEDAHRTSTFSNASAITLTVPPVSSVQFDIGAVISGYQLGAGQITVAPGSGVTINTAETLKTRAQYSAFSLIKQADNTWLMTGDIELAP